MAAPVGDTQYRLSGAVTKIDNNNDGRLHLRDFSGETYVYKIQGYTANSLKAGDIITLVGKRAEYQGSPQVSGAVLEEVKSVTVTTILSLIHISFGEGARELGKLLLKNYLYTLLEMNLLPSSLLFVNKGVNLTTEGSGVIDILKHLFILKAYRPHFCSLLRNFIHIRCTSH